MRVDKPTIEQVERVLDAYLRDVNAADFTPRNKEGHRRCVQRIVGWMKGDYTPGQGLPT